MPVKEHKSAETLKMSHSQEAKSSLELINDMELIHYFIVYHVIDWCVKGHKNIVWFYLRK